MAEEFGHLPNRWYADQSGNLHLNGGSLFDASENDVKNVVSGTAAGVKVAAGEYTTTSDDATANTLTITTGLTAVTYAVVQVVNSGNNVVTSDADVTFATGTIVVADGSTYNTVAGQKVRWIAFGT
jgi:hypothetical protein